MKELLGILMVLVLAASLAVGIIRADLTDGLVGYWPLDGNGEDGVGDSEGRLEGGANWTNDGRVNGAVELDGATGYVAVSGLELITNNLTVAAWLKGWRQDAWAGIVCSRGGTPFWMGFTDADTLSYVWNNNSDQTWGWKQGPMIPQDEWAMVAITIDPDKATSNIYTDADGMESAVNEIPHMEQTVADNLKFGWDDCDAGRHVMGIIDEVMIYDRALSESEILELATKGLAAVSPTGRLVTCWGEIKQR